MITHSKFCRKENEQTKQTSENEVQQKYRLGTVRSKMDYPRTPDYTLCSGVHVCWSEHSDSSFVYGFMILDYGFGTMTATTCYFFYVCTSKAKIFEYV